MKVAPRGKSCCGVNFKFGLTYIWHRRLGDKPPGRRGI